MSWIITGTEKLPSDPDAAAYIASVEAADGQALEYDVRMAINAFVRGCKADGIWNAVKASCILAGARTLNGALVPLVGTAPTNFNFIAGDYNRKTGLVGNGSTKYLNTNRANNADPQNNNHNAIYISALTGSGSYIGAGGITTGANTMGRLGAGEHFFRSRTTAFSSGVSTNPVPSFTATSRSSSATYTSRTESTSVVVSQASETPASGSIFVFARENAGSPDSYSNGRLAFYSIGESLNLELLDARVTTLINAFAAAIP